MGRTVIKAVIFDCFGVLIGDALKIEADKLWAAGKNQAAQEFHDLLRAADLQLLPLAETRQRQAELLGVTVDELVEIVKTGEAVNWPLVEYIRSIKSQYKIGMVSNINGRAYVEAHFDSGVLDELFDVIVTSGEVGHVKPAPEIYQAALDRLEVAAEETVMTDDIERYVEGAAAVGIHPIWFHNLEQFKTDFQKILEEVNGN